MDYLKFTKFVILIFISLYTNSQAQNQPIVDSLKQRLSTTNDALEKVKLHKKIAYQYRHIDQKKSIVHVEEALQIAPKEEFNLRGSLYNFLGVLTNQISNQELALIYLDTALLMYQEASNSRGEARVYSNRSMVYCDLHDYVTASELAYQSLAILDELKDTAQKAPLFANLMSIDMVVGDNDKAMKHARKALEIYQKIKHPTGISSIVYNIGLIHVKQEDYDSAMVYYNQALSLFQEQNQKAYEALVYIDKSNVYRIQKKLSLALDDLKKAIHLKETIQSKTDNMHLYTTLAELYWEQKDYKNSIATYQQILDDARTLQELSYQQQSVEGLVKNYVSLKDFEKAYHYKLEAEVLQDSMVALEKQEQIKELEIKYETAKKEQENILLAKDRDIQTLNANRNQQLAYGAIFMMVLILIIAVLLIRQYRANAMHQTQQLKHRLLRNQMSPHFIFNALVSIQNYVYKKEPLLAGEYLASFASLIRGILDNSMEEYILLNKEVQWLENYFKLQLLRFDNEFDYEISINEALDLENIQIPPMLTQPFIENALEHGLKNLDHRGKVKVDIGVEDKRLKVSIQDNGIGLKASQAIQKNKEHTSLAVKITKERLLFLNKGGSKINFDMKELETQGTLVAFSLPLQYKY